MLYCWYGVQHIQVVEVCHACAACSSQLAAVDLLFGVFITGDLSSKYFSQTSQLVVYMRRPTHAPSMCVQQTDEGEQRTAYMFLYHVPVACF